MKKLLAIIVSAILLASMLATSVAADGFADITVDFSSLPNGLENVDGVTLQSNKALNVHIAGKSGNSPDDTSDAVAAQWGYKGWIDFGASELITVDSTVTFWINLDGYPDGFCHSFPFMLTDAMNRAKEGENLGGFVTSNNKKEDFAPQGNKFIYVYNNADGNANVDENTTKTNMELLPNTWTRVDFIVDFTAKKTQIYMNYTLIGESNFTANALGYKGIKTFLVSSGNFDANMLVDELVVRSGKIVPANDDVCALQDRDAIEADDTVITYNAFDSKGGSASNYGPYPMDIVEVDAFNQSTMSVVVPHGKTEFEAYMELSETALKGNATVSFKVKNEFTVKKLPGLEIKLADANKKVLGGIVIGKDAGLCYDDGTNIYYATNADGQNIMTKSGQWYAVDMLVNYSNHSITVYLDGVRLGTVAMEASDMDGFSGILLSKVSNDGQKPQTFAFDNLSVIAGLYTPGAGSSLSDNDPLVTIDTQFSADKQAAGGTTADSKDEEKKDDAAETTADTEATSGGSNVTNEVSKADKKGCGSSLMAGSAFVAIAAAGVALASKKRKED